MATSPQGAGSSLTDVRRPRHLELGARTHTTGLTPHFHLHYHPQEKSDSSPIFKPCPSEADVLGQGT